MRGVNLAQFSEDIFTITSIYDVKKYTAMSRVLDRAGPRAGSSEGGARGCDGRVIQRGGEGLCDDSWRAQDLILLPPIYCSFEDQTYVFPQLLCCGCRNAGFSLW